MSLDKFLAEAFTEPELKRFVVAYDRKLESALPWGKDVEQVSFELVALLRRQFGQVPDRFVSALIVKFPARESEIRTLHREGHVSGTPSHSPSQESETSRRESPSPTSADSEIVVDDDGVSISRGKWRIVIRYSVALGILAAVGGAVFGFYRTTLRPSPVCAARAIAIERPRDGTDVGDRPTIAGKVEPACAAVWLVVHPMSGSTYFVQPKITVRNNGTWSASPYVGTAEAGEHEFFEIRVIANPASHLYQGQELAEWPAGEVVHDVTVRRNRDLTDGGVGGATAGGAISGGGGTVGTRPTASRRDAGPAPELKEIRGNIKSSGKRLYHLPGCPTYANMTPERTFASEAEARAAGFTKSPDCPGACVPEVRIEGTCVEYPCRVEVVAKCACPSVSLKVVDPRGASHAQGSRPCSGGRATFAGVTIGSAVSRELPGSFRLSASCDDGCGEATTSIRQQAPTGSDP